MTFDRRYLYDGNNLIAETDTSGNILRSYAWGLDLSGSLTASGGVGALLSLTNYSGGVATTYFAGSDGNGNIAVLVNASTGTLAAAYEYSPFGELYRSQAFDSTVADNPYRFSSKFTDLETGLVYYGARYHSPGLGRFINRDPIEEAGGSNLYGFCGNDAIDHVDYMGNSWLSKLWDRTILSLGRKIAINWDHGGRTYVQAVAAIVASIVTYGAASAWAGGLLASSVTSGAITATEAGIVSGAVGGFAAGVVGSAVGGANLNQALQNGAIGAVTGGILGGLGMSPQVNGIADVEHQFVTQEAIFGVNRFAEKQFGINGLEFDAALLATSYVGNELVGDRIQSTTTEDGVSENYLAGIFSRDPTSALLKGIEGNTIVRDVLGAPFDAVDIALNYQGIPSATGWEIALSHNAQNVVGAQSVGFGHSLGALEYSTLAGLGVLNGGAVAALPLGGVAPTGVHAYLGTSDLVNGSYLGKIFNWGATMVHEPAFSLLNPLAGHDLRNNYMPYMPTPEGG